MEFEITSSEDASEADIGVIYAGLRAYNEQHAGPPAFKRVHLFLRDADGVVHGGLLGKQLWGWLYVETLWLSETLRGKGYGTLLMECAEREARQAGCTHVLLDTFEFQARPFYERRGYEVFGVLEGFPPGFKRFYLRKELEDGEAGRSDT